MSSSNESTVESADTGQAHEDVPPGQAHDTATPSSSDEQSPSAWSRIHQHIQSRVPFLTQDQDTISTDAITTLKQFIAPEGIEWHPQYTKVGDIYSQTYYISSWPREAQANLLYELYTNPQVVYDASTHFEPFDEETAIERLSDIETRLEDKAEGEFSDLIPNVESVKQTLNNVQESKTSVETDGQRLYNISIYITVFSTEKDALTRIDRMIHRDIREGGGQFTLQTAREFPDLGHQSTAPLAENALADVRNRASQLLLDRAAATTFPLVDDNLIEESGVIVGFNLADDSAVVLDIFERNNGYNKLIIGDLGSGKSFGEKQYLLRHRHTHPDDNIIIIDPMGDFDSVTTAIGGEHVRVDGTKTVNPLELNETPQHVIESSEQIDPYRTKLDEVRWFFRTYFDSYLDDSLESELWAPLMKAVQESYRKNGIKPDPTTHGNPSPTLHNVLNNIERIADHPEEYTDSNSQREQDKWEERAVQLLMLLQPFRPGNELDNLTGHTDLEITTNRPTYIDLEAYEGQKDGMQSLMMKLVFSMVYEQIKETTERTIVAMDEAHKIIDSEEADHWEERFRHSRHHDLSIHLISQRFEDFFKSESGDGANEAAKSMADLCTVQQIHRVNDVNRRLAKEGLGLTDGHINFIENAVPGEDDSRQFTTALLRVADKGYHGLKLVPTEAEKDIIEFDVEDLSDPTTTVGNERIERTLELNRSTHGPESDSNIDPDLLSDIVEKVPLQSLNTGVVNGFIDRLIEDDETNYTESHRQLLERVLKGGDGTVSQYAPDLADRLAELNDPSGQPSPSPPSATSPPPIDETTAANQHAPDQQNSRSKAGKSPISSTNSPESHASDAMETSQQPTQSPVEGADHAHSHTDVDLPEAVTNVIRGKLPAPGETTRSITDPIPMTTRVECHQLALDRLSDEVITELAPIYTESPDTSLAELRATIATAHSRKEVDADGDDADICPVEQIYHTLDIPVRPAESQTIEQTPTETPPEARSHRDNGEVPGEIEALDTSIEVDDDISRKKRVKAHQKALTKLPTEQLHEIAAAQLNHPVSASPSDPTIIEIAEEYADIEINNGGNDNNINPGRLMRRYYPTLPKGK